MKYRKKPVVVEAVRWMGDNYTDVSEFVGESLYPHEDGSRLKIKTLEGTMIANMFDWIIRGVKGEFYPCKPSIFEANYESVRAEVEVERTYKAKCDCGETTYMLEPNPNHFVACIVHGHISVIEKRESPPPLHHYYGEDSQ